MTGIRPELAALAISIDSIEPHPSNIRQGDIGAISQSLSHHGQYRPIVVQRSTGFVLAGNHTLHAARSLGWPDIAATYVDCGDDQALRILLVDNRANDLATYDETALVAFLKELLETDLGLDGTLFDGDALDQLIHDLGREDEIAVDAPDTAPAITQLGDIWLLGQHRLMCGDSTDSNQIALLVNGNQIDMVWTDPPYGVDIQGTNKAAARNRRTDGKGVMNDNLTTDQTTEMLRSAFANAVEVCKDGGCWYVAAPSWPQNLICFYPLYDLGVWRHTMIWLKDSLVMGRMDYHYRHELILYGWKEGAAHQTPPDRTQDTIWEVARPTRSPEHPTMKPIELITRAINNSSMEGQIILDPFGGSGSTLIAAHITGRICYTIELDPHYCDIICARYQTQTGDLPRLEATGETHNFIPDAD